MRDTIQDVEGQRNWASSCIALLPARRADGNARTDRRG